jgi:hypothetical protein
MAGTIVADTLQADSTSTLVIKNGVANTPPTIQDSAGTQIGTFCRAWANWNGTTNTGGFCTIRGSFNVTSIADNGTGDYTVNLTTAMPDVNFSVAGWARVSGSGGVLGGSNDTAFTTLSIRVGTLNTSGVFADALFATVAIFR